MPSPLQAAGGAGAGATARSLAFLHAHYVTDCHAPEFVTGLVQFCSTLLPVTRLACDDMQAAAKACHCSHFCVLLPLPSTLQAAAGADAGARVLHSLL